MPSTKAAAGIRTDANPKWTRKPPPDPDLRSADFSEEAQPSPWTMAAQDLHGVSALLTRELQLGQ